jgi:hypothetical protein
MFLAGLILMLFGYITPRVLPHFPLNLGVGVILGIIFSLCCGIGLLMLIIGGIRAILEKRKND